MELTEHRVSVYKPPPTESSWFATCQGEMPHLEDKRGHTFFSRNLCVMFACSTALHCDCPLRLGRSDDSASALRPVDKRFFTSFKFPHGEANKTSPWFVIQSGGTPAQHVEVTNKARQKWHIFHPYSIVPRVVPLS